MFKKTTHEFCLSKETPKMILTSDKGFEKIEMLEVIGNQINKSDGPFGIRWTLFCANYKYDCFCWQLPDKFEFNCFELMDVFGFTDTAIVKDNCKCQSSEMHVCIEGGVVDENLIIDIKLEIEERVL
jgi:hypothetical protein